MSRCARACAGAALALACVGALPAQFKADEVAAWPAMEEFLASAEIVGERQISGREAVTSPWVLDLEKGGERHRGVWKNPKGRMAGFIEGWNYEIAAYRLDKLLGLNMVPPTIERRFREEPGSLQLYVEGCITLKEKDEKQVKMPSIKIFGWNRGTYLQRAWDNLIGNPDRHMNQILLTPDWRMILIDHSRAFGDAKYKKKLIFTEKHPEGPKLMTSLPRAFVERLKALDAPSVKAAVGDTLSDAEIEAVLSRRDLILAEVDKLVRKNGEKATLY